VTHFLLHQQQEAIFPVLLLLMGFDCSSNAL